LYADENLGVRRRHRIVGICAQLSTGKRVEVASRAAKNTSQRGRYAQFFHVVYHFEFSWAFSG
jgi:hypothetical protein